MFKLTKYEQEELAALKEELSAHIEKMNQVLARHTSGNDMNPAGDIGGIRSRSRRQKRQIFSRYTREAQETVAMTKKMRELEQKIRWLKEKPSRDKAAFERGTKMLAWWGGLKPGDHFTPGNVALTITKKNRLSLVTSSGVKWDISEVTGLSRDEIKHIRRYTNE